jgi:hypothetical protein
MRKPVVLLTIAVFVLLLPGCAAIHSAPDLPPSQEERQKEEAKARETAVKEYRYQGLRDELIVEKPVVSPDTVSRGGEVVRDVRFTILSPEKT